MSLRGVLDAVTAEEPEARVSEFQLSITLLGKDGSIVVSRYLPAPPNVVSTRSHRYHAAIVNGVVQRPQRIERDDVLTNADGSGPALIDAQTTSSLLGGDTLVEIEQALEAVRGRYHSAIQMNEVTVSYTSVRSMSAQSPAEYGYIVFLTPPDVARDYTVLTRNRIVHNMYQGNVDPADWLNSEYWLRR